MNELQKLKAGMPITDIGNHRVGKVAAVEDDAFKMDILNDGSIWLREDSLFWVGIHSAVLICARNGVERYAT